MARRAFYDDLPPEIRNRRNKGGIEEHLRRTLEHNRGFLRELLLDGALVRQGVVDRGRLAEVLSGRATRIAAGSGRAPRVRRDRVLAASLGRGSPPRGRLTVPATRCRI